MTKEQIIRKVFKAVKAKGEVYFDIYIEKDERYLNKLYTVINNWK